MHVVVYFPGKIKQAGLQELSALYQERLSHYLHVEVRTYKEGDIRGLLDRLAEARGKGARTILLDAGGTSYSSEAFARWFGEMAAKGHRECIFVFGGAFGLSPDEKACFDQRLSLSPLTFPHELSAVVFLEQLFRAQKILKGEAYHY